MGALPSGTTAVDVLLHCARMWIQLFESVGTTTGPWRKKLWALTLISLVPSGLPPLVANLDEILNTVLDVLVDIDRTRDFDPDLFIPAVHRGSTRKAVKKMLDAPVRRRGDDEVDEEEDDAAARKKEEEVRRAVGRSSAGNRRRFLHEKDEVVTTDLQAFALARVDELASTLGPQLFREKVLDVVEPTLLEHLRNPPKPRLPDERD